jgi:hypothetical protein
VPLGTATTRWERDPYVRQRGAIAEAFLEAIARAVEVESSDSSHSKSCGT